MTVEDQRGEDGGSFDRFPVGMRVLAVDDNPTCLRILESLLRKCQYQVTTTNQAIKALKMLRKNRNRFDLVISDVNMPDMDGFKLLELVGLEMDLPVIMLSEYSDTKLVMKGITHGAVDYLLKPVRMEEVKNIWQHVIRRKKLDPCDQGKHSDQGKTCQESGEGGKGVTSIGLNQNATTNRKRKDQDEDEEDEGEYDEHESEDPSSTQKKPRVVWSPELHKKFCAAVHKLGPEKAVPKKILDMMNEEGLTRENVASHLQKYRLYLKRLPGANQQARLVAALRAKGCSYVCMDTLDGFGDMHTMNGSGRLASSALSSSYTHGGMLGRLNSPSGLTIGGISSNGLIQPGNPQSLSSSFSTLGKFQPSISVNQSASLFQGIPTLEHNKLQQTKSTAHIGEFNPLNSSSGFAVPASFPDMRVTPSSSSTVRSSSSNPLMGDQSSVRVTPLLPESFDGESRGSSDFLDHNHYNESWEVAVQSSNFSSITLLRECSSHGQIHSNNLGIPSTTAQISNSPHEFSSSNAFLEPLAGPRDGHGHGNFIGNAVQSADYTEKHRWDNHNLNQDFGTLNSIVDQLNGCTSSAFESNEIENSAMVAKTETNEDFIENIESLDDIMSAMMKRG
ncbi:two-component response regulator ORR24 [Cannabis sativa]|uniref:Two-component response regulator n=1 Tax=Cannabis sativa TaxID=3483 RepID=A0A803QBE1_CANSA|nr:two-component response regulator ORR24 [Cannabis sativa]